MQIKIDLSSLYDLSSGPKQSAAQLLIKMLEYYNISFKFIAVANPDFPQILIFDKELNEKTVNIEIEKVVENCNIVVELFDGYETAFACVGDNND